MKNLLKWSYGCIDARIYFLIRTILSIGLLYRFLNWIPYVNKLGLSATVLFTILFFAILLFSMGYFIRLSSIYIATILILLFLKVHPFEFAIKFHETFTQILAFCCLSVGFMTTNNVTIIQLLNGTARKYVFGTGVQFLKFLILLIYFCSVINKLNHWYLSGVQVHQIFLQNYWGSDPLPEGFSPVYFQLLAWISILFEALIFLGLCLKKYRNRTVLLALFFHLTLYLFLQIGAFSIVMAGIVLIFIDPDKLGLTKQPQSKDELNRC